MAQRDLLDIHKENLYDLLGVPHDATSKQITRSYRKKALKVHPDKNPDPAAHKLFLKLTQVLELLTDEKSRGNYDTVLKAREAAKLRTQQLDVKRRKLKERLESRESGATGSISVQKAKRALDETIKNLQAEGENLLKREEERLRKEFTDKTDFVIADKATVKIRWKRSKIDNVKNGGYSESVLQNILQKYGPVSDIIVNPKREGSALAVFDSIAGAKICVQKEKGLEGCPLSFRIIHDSDKDISNHAPSSSSQGPPNPVPPPPSDIPKQNQFSSFPTPGSFSSFPSFNAHSYTSNKLGDVDRDYESLTLMRLRQAEERKRLIEEIDSKDTNEVKDDEND